MTYVVAVMTNGESLALAVSGDDIETMNEAWRKCRAEERMLPVTLRKRPGFLALLNPAEVSHFAIVAARGSRT